MDFSEIDKQVFLILNAIHNGYFDVLMNWLSSLLIWIPLSLYITYVLIKNFNLKTNKSLFFNILIISVFAFFQYLVCVELSTSFFESMVHRVRPSSDPDILRYMNFDGVDPENKFGFFSPRACLAFSLATFLYFSLWDKDRILKIIFIAFAILISYSRIYLGLHYPANIVVSALVGILIGALSYPAFFYVKNSIFRV